MRVDHIKNWRSKCTGCAACENVCPKNAIQMIIAADGFEYPRIDEAICVHCGLCEKVCSINKSMNQTRSKSVQAAKALNEQVRSRGSSGGIFEIAAEYVLASGGVVYGAAFDPDCKSVKHSSSYSRGLEPLLRSKYVQSKIGGVYRDVGDQLKSGNAVLFSGTPCQVRGLLGFLETKEISGDLTTIDFFCHGVPSPGILKEYIEVLEHEHDSNVINITFREKEEGWHKQSSRIYFSNGNHLGFESSKHFYYYLFLNNYILRDSCYGCREYCSHTADITMADYWSIAAEKDDDQGMSLVLINTEKGMKLWKSIAGELSSEPLNSEAFDYNPYSHKKYDYNRKIKCMKVYQHSGIEGLRRRFFFERYVFDYCERKARHIGGTCKRLIKAVIWKR